MRCRRYGGGQIAVMLHLRNFNYVFNVKSNVEGIDWRQREAGAHPPLNSEGRGGEFYLGNLRKQLRSFTRR